MGKIIKIAIVLGILLLIVMAALVMVYSKFNSYDESTLRSNYNFRIALTTNSKLENPTFIVPIPVGNEGLVNMVFNESAQKSDGWNISMIETEYGKMFKISAKEIVPQVHKNIELDPDTNMPTGNEPLLSQKFNLTISHYGEEPPAYNSQKTLSYDSIIYADYTSSPDAVVEVFVDLNGVNEWWQGGSGFNRYQDRLGTTFKGEKHGWFSVTGELAEGEGFRSIPQSSR